MNQILAIAASILLVISLLYYGEHMEFLKALTPEKLQRIIFFLHIPFVFFCVVYLIRILEENGIGSSRVIEAHACIFNESKPLSKSELRKAKQHLKSFKKYFLGFWLSMLALYLAFLLIDSFVAREKGPPPPEAGAADNSSPAVAPSAHSTPTPEPVPETPTFSNDRWLAAFIHVLPDFLPFALNTLSLLFISWCLSLLYRPYQTARDRTRHRMFLSLSCVVIMVLILVYPLFFNLARDGRNFTEHSLEAYSTVFNAMSGFLNAVVLALLIARLDSKLIGLPSWLVSVLYFYAAVQPLFVVFAQKQYESTIIKTAVLLIVFILKIYFFLIIVYAMQTGRLLNYFACFPWLEKRASAIFDNPFEISILKDHGHAYEVAVHRHGFVAFLAEEKFPTRDASSSFIERLRKIMSGKASYRVLQGPYGPVTVEVVTDNAVVCSSVDLKSEDEALALIEQSVAMVPYCLMNRHSI